ncbi:uncharacterized protein K452DRAFT_333074 [Aplosporella prunicola CBS 121167]|uniref:Uncharacterized protein n=1 Tax=Aplosporella prunicola CBS 121167 TaxID=1176127 RepID=A0A6A6BDW5_9PEZI|nr:uncharacterized protein K452DRAFT_333074 [Aplosporella prunicola CBS 121167]KAF2142266.1 hypothetical protein K452DRAFT_333074 [Aplosporella prunicola CBS 121167]
MDAHYEIYTGIWTDWSHNKLLGITLTTTRTHGSFLIAFLSLFVAVIGTSTWKICCFILHYIYSTEASRDALYHQRQAILRNSANASTGISSLFLLLKAWQTQSTKAYQRILPLLAFSCLILAAFAVASTFSSRISSVGTAVLLSGTNCGYMYPLSKSSDPMGLTTVFQPYLSQKHTSDADYAQECYPDIQSTEGCNTFVQRRLSTSVIRNAFCPFPGDICKSQDSNLLLDTGLVDSHNDLGINAPPGHRYQFRFVNLGPSSYARYYYGPRLQVGRLQSHHTYQYMANQKNQFVKENFTSVRPTMDIDVYGAQHANGSLVPVLSNIAPIKELERTDADLYIAFLSLNALLFPEKSDDIWYSAHDFAFNKANKVVSPNNPTSLYWSDEPASPMGLVLQYQLCKPDLPDERRCTELSSFIDAYYSAVALWEESKSGGPFEWFTSILQGPQDPLLSPIKVLGQTALDSITLMGGGFLGPLRENQWQLDVEKWTNITLASIQKSFVEAVTGPPNAQQKDFQVKPEDNSQKRMCQNQKILSTAYTNFSVFGLALILTVGGITIILSYILEPLVVWIQHRRNLDVYARLEWTMNGTLQLQRLAHEELGLVPVTEKCERLGVMDLKEKSHPKLKAPPPGLEEILKEESEDRLNQDQESGKDDTQEELTELCTPARSSSSEISNQ